MHDVAASEYKHYRTSLLLYIMLPHVANKSSFNNAPLHKLVVQMNAVISVTSMSNEHATVYRQ